MSHVVSVFRLFAHNFSRSSRPDTPLFFSNPASFIPSPGFWCRVNDQDVSSGMAAFEKGIETAEERD